MAYRYIPTEQDLRMLKQHIKNVSIKIDILNKNMQPIDKIEGVVINDDYSINVDSDIRRTYSASLRVTKDYNMIDLYKKLWIDKILQVYIGVEDLLTNEMVWYLFGTFTFDVVTYDIGAESNVLNINCIDLAAKYNGALGGTLTDPILIPAYNDDEQQTPNTIRGAMISTIVDLAGITKYSISDMDKEIPHDLEFGAGATIWEVIATLRDLYAGWETFFDTDGTFVCQPIPTTIEEPVFLTNDVFNDLVIHENDTDDASAVRNFSKLNGRTLDYDYHCETVTVETDANLSNVYEFSFDYNALVAQTERSLFKFPSLPNASANTYFYYTGGEKPLEKIDVKNVDSLNDWYYMEDKVIKKEPKIFEVVSHSLEVKKGSGKNSPTKTTLIIDFGVLNEPFSITTPYCIKWPIDANAEEINYVKLQWTYDNKVNYGYLSTSETSTRNGYSHSVSYNFKKDTVYFIKRTSRTLQYRVYVTRTDSEGNEYQKLVTKTDNRYIDGIYTINYLDISPIEIIKKTIFNLSSLSESKIELSNGDTVAFYPPQKSDPDLYLFYNGKIHFIRDDNGEPLTAGILRPEILYVFKYSGGVFYYVGEQQISVIVKEVINKPTSKDKEDDMKKYQCQNIVYYVDPKSQFAIEVIGERKTVYQDGNYAKIYTTTLAIERMQYEHWRTTRLNSSAVIDIVAIPWLMGNEKIQYTKKVDGVTSEYLIKQITGTTKDWVQTLNLVKFYPLVPQIIQSNWSDTVPSKQT